MKKFMKFALLTAIIVSLFAGMAFAYPISPKQIESMRLPVKSAAGESYYPHCERIVKIGDAYYGLVQYSSTGALKYVASEIIKFDSDLNVISRVKLANDSSASLNASSMALYGNELYISSMGGYQEVGTYGNIWKVNISDMTATPVLDAGSLVDKSIVPSAMVQDIVINKDGKIFFMIITYDEDYNTSAALYLTNVENIKSSKIDKSLDISADGYSWRLIYDDNLNTLWTNEGGTLKAYNSDLTEIPAAKKTPADLGGSLYTMAPITDGIFYQTSDYDSASSTSLGVIGTVKKTSTTYTAAKGSANFKGDALAVSLGGSKVALIEHFDWGYSPDSITAWANASDLSRPIYNIKLDFKNTHGAFVDGDILLTAGYEEGEFAKLDLSGLTSTSTSVKKLASYIVTPQTDNDKPAVVTPTIPSGAPAAISFDVAALPELATGASFDISKDAKTDLKASDFTTTADGTTVLKSSLLEDFADIALIDGILNGGVPVENGITALPVVAGTVPTGTGITTTVVALSPIPGSAFGDGTFANANVLKVVSSDKVIAFQMAEEARDLADGKFAVLSGGNLVKKSDAIIQSENYTLQLFIKDGGDYDLSPANDKMILDPAMIVKTRHESSSSSSSCSAGAFGLVALAALGALTIKRRQR